MLTLFYPKTVLDNVFELTPERLRAAGFTAIFCDLDDTLSPYNVTRATPELQAWTDRLKAGGIALCILTNGKTKRVTPMCRELGVPCVPLAMKPTPFGFWRALRRMGVKRHQALVVGDQIFTDVIGGNSAGLYTVLVQPLAYKTGAVERWKRRRELPFRKARPCKKGRML